MEKVLKFKTNIKCMGCVANVTPELDQVVGAQHWEVDITSPDKVLTVKTGTLDAEDVAAAVSKAGYTATPLVGTDKP
ncbi:MAG: heavy-metal-associated domain-containing protein [Saprospiraceae bacterium]|jgi:copper chaperone|nr:heavy-metal-associated domain-containing protein [Saprospiraceae bacterium]